MIDITELYKSYLDVKNLKTHNKNTLFLIEDVNYFFAFNMGAFTLRHVFNGFICDDSVVVNEKRVKIHYCAIPKQDYSVISDRIAKYEYRSAFITLIN